MWKKLATDLAKDLAIGPAAGYLATGVLERTNMILYQNAEPETDRAREDETRPGPPPRIAADKMLRLAGVKLDEPQVDTAGTVMHYALPIAWAPSTPHSAAPPASAPYPPGWPPVQP